MFLHFYSSLPEVFTYVHMAVYFSSKLHINTAFKANAYN